MGSPSPKIQDESSRQYELLLRGQITSAQYVQALKKDAHSRVESQRLNWRRRAAAA